MIQRITSYRCEDGKIFEDAQDAQLHQQTIIADSRLSDFLVMECSGIVQFRDTGALVEMVRAINKEFLVVRCTQELSLEALEVELCNLRGEVVPQTIQTLLKAILKTEQIK